MPEPDFNPNNSQIYFKWVLGVVFQIVDFHHVPFLSANTILKLGLIEVCYGLGRQTSTEKIISEFRDVFTGLEKLQNEVNIEIDSQIEKDSSCSTRKAATTHR
jgi:hypothetical protein